MMHAIRLEFYKLRRKRLTLMFALFLAVELGWAFASLSMSIARRPDNAGWPAAIATVASMNGLFLPILSAVIVSRICDMEHKGQTWKLLMSAAVARSRIYAAKYIAACLLLAVAVALQTAGIAAFGMARGWAEAVPVSLLLRYAAGTMLATAAIVALQQWLSLAVKNQAFALALGMLGGFAGMTADLFPAGIRAGLIWSYFTGLSPVTFGYIDETMRYVLHDISPSHALAALAMGAAAYIAGSIHVSRQEI